MDTLVKSRCLGLLEAGVNLTPKNPSKGKEVRWAPDSYQQDNGCVSCHFILKPVQLTSWKTLDAVGYRISHPARLAAWNTCIGVKWCAALTVRGKEWITYSITLVINSTQPQMTELHRPSDKSPPPPTLGMEWHWTGVKSIYLISVMGLFL